MPENPDFNTDLNNNAAETNPDCLITPVTRAEVKAALKKLKSWKALVTCGITAEMLRAGGENMVRWLGDIINFVCVHD